MRGWPKARSFLRNIVSWRRVDAELDQEVRAHLRLLIDENIRTGMAAKEAERAARMELGGIEQVKEQVREAHVGNWLDSVFADLRFGVRQLRRNPGFTAVAVLTLALGIGANTAIFSVVYAVLLKPLPYTHAEQLFTVSQKSEDAPSGTGISYANLADLRRQNRIFSEVAGSQHHQLTLTGRGEPAVVNASVVTEGFFPLFDEKPLLGRVLSPEDGKAGAPPVAVLSENLWRDLFAGDAGVLGSSIDLDKISFTVVGIMPARFRFPLISQSEQLWIPLVHDPLFGSWMPRRGGHWLQITGRLKPEVSKAQAQAELDALSARFSREFPEDNAGWSFQMTPLQQLIVGDVKPALLVLLGAVGLVLLVACANIANLLLTRATTRAREMAVRATLGAGRARIIRQLLSETAVLGLLGGMAGIFLAWWGVQGLGALLPENLPRVNAIRVDYFVLGFALALSAAASCGFGLAPAFFMADANLRANLREGGGRSGESGKSRRARSILAAGEITLAMVLLVGAGLLLRSFAKLVAVSPGFDAQHIVKAEISLPRAQYSTPRQWLAFADELVARIQAEPGLQDSAVAVPTPLADGCINLGFDIVGSPTLAAGESRTANYVAATPEYFRVMGIALLAGRLISERDAMGTPRVTVISKAMAERYFANQNPIGNRLSFGFPPDSGAAREIVGIVGDVRDVALGENPGAMMYVPYAQAPLPGAVLVVRSRLSTSSVAAAIRSKVRQIDKDLPVSDVMRMADAVDTSVAQPRFRTLLLALFAAMALALAATGIFGVVSYSVSCRTREIGIRVALGASHGAIRRMVLRETMSLTLAGLAVGVPCALAASRLIGHMLFGVSANDPLTIGMVLLTLVSVATLAGYVPMRRAMRVDPIVALRYE